MSTSTTYAQPTFSAVSWMVRRAVLRTASVYVLWHLLWHAWRPRWRHILLSHRQRLYVLASWRLEVHAMLRAAERAGLKRWGSAAPSSAELRANTWQTMPAARRPCGTRRGFGRRPA